MRHIPIDNLVGAKASAFIFIGQLNDRALLAAENRAIKDGCKTRFIDYPFDDRTGPKWGKLLFEKGRCAAWVIYEGIREEDVIITSQKSFECFANEFVIILSGELRCQRQTLKLVTTR